jgi:hypothetical protein
MGPEPASRIKLKVDRDLFAPRVHGLISTAANLQAYGVGPQPAANRSFRQHFLGWMAEVEQVLAWGVEGVDIAVGMQTPRLMSIVEDRVPDLELYRALEAELGIKVEVLSALASQLGSDDRPTAVVAGAAELLAHPRAFVSHASEDKNRFVVEFARRLRAVGIDAWLDHWELQPGDSLVDRIFEEGIGAADAFIVVLSENSVDKKWVREELNAAVVRRLSEGTRLIPILIDDVGVPVVLQSTLWVKIGSLSSYDAELAQIVRTIYGHTAKPALGPPPAWVHPRIQISGVSAADSTVLSLAAEQAVVNGHRFVDAQQLLESCAKVGIDAKGCIESLSALGHADLMNVEVRQPAIISRLEITNYGLGVFLEATRPDLLAVRSRLIAELVNRSTDSFPVEGSELNAIVGEAPLVVELLLDELDARSLITFAKYLGNTTRVHGISPLLHRELE